MKRTWMFPVVVLAACAGHSSVSPQIEASLNETFPVRVGQVVTFGEAPLRLAFDSVSDSRCPKSVQCVWAGNGRVALKASVPDSAAKAVELNTNTSVAPPVAAAFGYSIRLERLDPYPATQAGIPQEEYAAYLTVRRQ